MAAVRPEMTGRKPRGPRQEKQTEPVAARAPPAAERLVYTVPEAGRLLGLSRNGSYEAAKRGDIPTIRMGVSCWCQNDGSTSSSSAMTNAHVPTKLRTPHS